MRSTVAGIAALIVFGMLQALAKTFFPEALIERGLGRDMLSAVIMGATFATFFAVY